MTTRAFDPGQCPVGRTLERVGDTWSLMILRDAQQGLTRFDAFEKSLGVAPNILAKRLAGLVQSGFLERRPYQDRPVRREYVLTAQGRDFAPVLTALLAFGNRHFAQEGIASQLIDRATGQAAEPILVDAVSGRPIDAESFTHAAGPAAGEPLRRRVAEIEARRDRDRDGAFG